MSRLDELWETLGNRCVAHGNRDCDGCQSYQDCESCAKWERIGEALNRERDEAVTLLRAIWHGEGTEKWPDPSEFRRRVEALVGPSPTGRALAVTYYEGNVPCCRGVEDTPRIEDITIVSQEYGPVPVAEPNREADDEDEE
jgi:hypothetical protein